jgi:hypothetical protein
MSRQERKKPSVRLVVEFQGNKDVVRRISRNLEAIAFGLNFVDSRRRDERPPLETEETKPTSLPAWAGLF